RTEIIENLFLKHENINHICHAYTRIKHNITFDINRINYKIMKQNVFENKILMGKMKLHNGNISIRKSIINKIVWDRKRYRGQDVQLNKNIFKVYKKFIFIQLPIYIYRENFTA